MIDAEYIIPDPGVFVIISYTFSSFSCFLLISLTSKIRFFLSNHLVNSLYFVNPSLMTISSLTFLVAVAVSATIGKSLLGLEFSLVIKALILR